MTQITITAEQLRAMIGLRVRHDGVHCEIVEVLEDGPSLVLQDIGAQTTIQPDQHGDARRRVPRVFTIAVLAENGTAFSATFLNLEPLDTW